MKGHMMIRPDDDYPEQVQCKPYENFFQGFWNPSLWGACLGPPHLADPPSEDDPTGLGTPDVKPSAQSLCLTPLLQNLKTSIFLSYSWLCQDWSKNVAWLAYGRVKNWSKQGIFWTFCLAFGQSYVETFHSHFDIFHYIFIVCYVL